MENEHRERSSVDAVRGALAALMAGAFLVGFLVLPAIHPSASEASFGVEKMEATTTSAPGDYVVVYRDTVSLASRIRSEEARGIEADNVFRRVFKGFSGELSTAEVERLRGDERVLLVEPDLEVTTQSNGPQRRAVQSWGLDRIDQRDRSLNGRLETADNGFGVDAYIIDTGIRLDHDEFSGRINPEGFSAFDGGWNDCRGHGTHVAGTVAGSSHGVAPAARLTAVRVLDCEGSGSISSVIAGIEWMIEHHRAGNPAVANMSLGGSLSVAMNLAVRRAVDDEIVVVAAAGNEKTDACASSPASAPEAVTVGSTESNDEISNFSNFGRCLDLFAPGSKIKSAWHTSRSATNTISGTSMASPHAAGAAALMLARDNDLSPEAVARRLTESGTPDRVTNAGCTQSRILFVGSGPDLSETPLPPPPVNDNFENRRILGSLGTVTARNTCATAEVAEPGHGIPPFEYRATSSIWFEWSAPLSGTVTFDLEGSDFDALAAVYSGESLESLALEARIERFSWRRMVSLKVDAGSTHYIAIDGESGRAGNVRLTGTFTPGPGPLPNESRPGPSNDNFAHAREVGTGNSWRVSGNSEGATGQIGEPNHASWWSGGPFGSVWYRWAAPHSGVLSLDSGDDLALYSGSSISSLEAVHPSQQCFSICEPVFPVRKGEIYSIAVDTWPGLEGSHHVTGSLALAPDNDDFANARTIRRWSGRIEGTTFGATREPYESGHGYSAPRASHSVWYRWTAPWSGDVTLITRFGDDWIDAAVYSGQSIGSLRKVASSGSDETTWSPRKGETYWIALDVDGSQEPGPFTGRLRRNMENLRIVSGPRLETRSRTARFRFEGDQGALFECRLNGRIVWRPCTSRTTFRRLAPGLRVLTVRQKYGTSYTEPVFYAEYLWWIDRPHRR